MPFLSIIMGFLNFKKLIPLFLKNWKIIMFLLMAAVLGYQNFSGTRFLFGAETIPSLSARLDAAEYAFKTCKEGNDVLSNAIDQRNSEVKKWKGISLTLEKNISNLENDLKGRRAKTKTVVDAILKDDTPKTCEASIDYLRNARKDLKW